uniref:Uncharacterized protein n=1 Tax=Romanomermis culicivorax TaxID=13658 RepID=A0A915KYZ4_ROMCU
MIEKRNLTAIMSKKYIILNALCIKYKDVSKNRAFLLAAILSLPVIKMTTNSKLVLKTQNYLSVWLGAAKTINMMKITDYFKKPQFSSNCAHEIGIINLGPTESENIDYQMKVLDSDATTIYQNNNFMDLDSLADSLILPMRTTLIIRI